MFIHQFLDKLNSLKSHKMSSPGKTSIGSKPFKYFSIIMLHTYTPSICVIIYMII